MAVLVAALATGCSRTDYHMLARFSAAEDRPSMMAVVPMNAGPHICNDEAGEYRIMVAGSMIEFQKKVRPSEYPGVEKFEPVESVQLAQSGFTEISVGSPKPRIEIVIADKVIVTAAAERVGGTLLRCAQFVQ